MRVNVLFFGMLKDLAGKPSDSIELEEGSSLGDVVNYYRAHNPKLKDALSTVAIALNREYASLESKLQADDEIGLLPPVSGGVADTRHRVSIVRDRIDSQHVLSMLKRGEDGAAVAFEGIVRNETRGRRVLYLEYEAYEEMALREMDLLVDQALKQFAIRNAAIVHRLGRLQIGETSVLVVVVSAHRAAAFDACRWLIDTLKRTVPIWKKEYFEDGAVWADGEPFPDGISQPNRTQRGSPDLPRASK